jgi:hypothetical protein
MVIFNNQGAITFISVAYRLCNTIPLLIDDGACNSAAAHCIARSRSARLAARSIARKPPHTPSFTAKQTENRFNENDHAGDGPVFFPPRKKGCRHRS